MSSSGTRRRVLSAALKCFSAHGVAGSSVEQIRALSGVSVGSIYHHFGGKEGIALALYLEGLRQANKASLRRLHAARGAQAGVAALVRAFTGWVAQNPEWARYLYATSAVWASGPAAELKALNEAYFVELEAWFRPHIRAGRVRKLPVMALVAIVFGPVFTYARRWLLGEAASPLQRLAPVFAEAAWRGVSPDRGVPVTRSRRRSA